MSTYGIFRMRVRNKCIASLDWVTYEKESKETEQNDAKNSHSEKNPVVIKANDKNAWTSSFQK